MSDLHLIKVITPTETRIMEVSPDMTVDELREKMNLSPGFKASSNSVSVAGSEKVSGYNRIAFAGKADSGK